MKAKFRSTPQAYELFHEGALALAEVERAGVRVDRAYLDEALKRSAHDIRELEAELRKDEVYTSWRRRFGEKAKLGSRSQLAAVMFGELGYKPRNVTEGGERGKADKDMLEHIDIPFAKTYTRYAELVKARSTYLMGIKREMVETVDGWFVHPIYNLNTVTTFRSSCDNPNFQNNPVRNPELADLIRRCYIPRRGGELNENDYSQIEVRVAGCYNFDPVLLTYINDPATDMHRDMACELFFLKPGEVGKAVRHAAKNSFVFPSFYGSAYFQCARHLWEAVVDKKLKVEGSDETVKKRLRRNGIKFLGECDPDQSPAAGSFEAHIQRVEKAFWNERFKVYTKWKREWYEAYQRTGGFVMHTGFAVNAVLKRNDVINYPIQGAAFHCLLYALTRMVRRLRRYKMRSRVVGQIHDCMVGDVRPSERDAYQDMIRDIMVNDVAKHWADWIIVPLAVETEVCPIDGPWVSKAEWVRRGDRYEPKDGAKWEAAFGSPVLF